MFIFYPGFNPATDEGMFDKPVDAIVNTVNTRGTSKRSRGVAGQVFRKYDGVFQAYQRACTARQMFPGAIQQVRIDRQTGMRDAKGDLLVLNVATKDDWRDPSRLDWIDAILDKLPVTFEKTGIRSIALPPLGCGEGGLDWMKDVGPRVLRCLDPLVGTGVAVHIFATDPDPSRGMSRSVAPDDNRIGHARLAFGGLGPRTPAAETEQDIGAAGHGTQDGARDEARDGAGDAPAYAGVGARPLSAKQPTGAPPDILVKQRRIGEILAREGFLLRSGAAAGSDAAFEAGCDRAGGAKQIFLPQEGFNGRQSDATSVLADIPPDLFEKANNLLYDHHPRGRALSGFAFHAMRRNSFQVLGPDLASPSKLVLCYTDGGKTIGGTGHAIRLAEASGVPVLNMGEPFWRHREAEEIARAAGEVIRGDRTLDEVRARLAAPQAREQRGGARGEEASAR